MGNFLHNSDSIKKSSPPPSSRPLSLFEFWRQKIHFINHSTIRTLIKEHYKWLISLQKIMAFFCCFVPFWCCAIVIYHLQSKRLDLVIYFWHFHSSENMNHPFKYLEQFVIVVAFADVKYIQKKGTTQPKFWQHFDMLNHYTYENSKMM